MPRKRKLASATKTIVPLLMIVGVEIAWVGGLVYAVIRLARL